MEAHTLVRRIRALGHDTAARMVAEVANDLAQSPINTNIVRFGSVKASTFVEVLDDMRALRDSIATACPIQAETLNDAMAMMQRSCFKVVA